MDIELRDKWRLILGLLAEGDMPLHKEQEYVPPQAGAGACKSSRRYTLNDLDKCLSYVYEQQDESEQESRHGQGHNVPQSQGSLRQGYSGYGYQVHGPYGQQGQSCQGHSSESQGSDEASLLRAAQWLNTSQKLFPEGIYEVIQKDALAHGRLLALLHDDQFVEQIKPNMGLLSAIVAMKNQLKGKALDNARALVNSIVEELKEHFKLQAQRAFYGKRDPNARPVKTFKNLDIKRIIKANIRYYQTDEGYIIPQRLFFIPKSIRMQQHDIFVLLDQSSSMIDSYAYSAIIASVFAQLGCLRTSLVVYSSEVADYSEQLDDVVELLFKASLKQGTATCKALKYIEPKIVQPHKTLVVLLSDLYDENFVRMVKMIKEQIAQGVTFMVLPALSDKVPAYFESGAKQLAALGAHVAPLRPEQLVEYVAQIIHRK